MAPVTLQELGKTVGLRVVEKLVPLFPRRAAASCQLARVHWLLTESRMEKPTSGEGCRVHVHGSADVSFERPVPAVTCLLRGACGPLLGQRGRAWTVRSASYFPDSAPAQASAKTVRLRGRGPAAAPVAWARSLCLAPQLARRPLISPGRLCAGLVSSPILTAHSLPGCPSGPSLGSALSGKQAKQPRPLRRLWSSWEREF